MAFTLSAICVINDENDHTVRFLEAKAFMPNKLQGK
jgi:hypothetical protein